MLYDVPAPAKLNLFLHVVGRRPDGYHLLQTVFRFIDLSDVLSFDLRRDGQLSCENDLDIPPESDLVLRAARLLQQHTGVRQGAHIVCRKHIPAGGGLGGGSSDAATTLIALNRLWQTGLDRTALARLGVQLGADVPVFLYGQPAFAEGIGEQLTAVPVPDCAYLVVQPDAFVSTPEVFSAPELTRDSESIKITFFADWQKDCESFFGRNDLEHVVMARYPAVQAAQKWLAQQGVVARMTGSGACMFAQYPDLQQASSNQKQIAGKIAVSLQESSNSTGSMPLSAIRQVWACVGLQDHPLRYW